MSTEQQSTSASKGAGERQAQQSDCTELDSSPLSYFLEERNGRPQHPGLQYSIYVVPKGMESPSVGALPNQHGHSSLDQAVAEIEYQLRQRHAQLLEEAQGCLDQLAKLQSFYQPTVAPLLSLQLRRNDLVAMLRNYRASGRAAGSLHFEGIQAELPYQQVPNLFVVKVPEEGAVRQTLTEPAVEFLKQVIAEAGYTDFVMWNGAGNFSVSFRLRPERESEPL